MGTLGEKQKANPKISDKKQSERFKEPARKVGPGESSDGFDELLEAMAPPKIRKE
jgi:hypothetical protein